MRGSKHLCSDLMIIDTLEVQQTDLLVDVDSDSLMP